MQWNFAGMSFFSFPMNLTWFPVKLNFDSEGTTNLLVCRTEVEISLFYTGHPMWAHLKCLSDMNSGPMVVYGGPISSSVWWAGQSSVWWAGWAVILIYTDRRIMDTARSMRPPRSNMMDKGLPGSDVGSHIAVEQGPPSVSRKYQRIVQVGEVLVAQNHIGIEQAIGHMEYNSVVPNAYGANMQFGHMEYQLVNSPTEINCADMVSVLVSHKRESRYIIVQVGEVLVAQNHISVEQAIGHME
ncbi:hypothetical protein DFH29DRAFT_882384 [Suillus ampliporus]|nr:hypothetical protein DFH29DRAFT_882384 [Suillus ampliporus]